MGASLRARKNPFEAQGLVPGITVRLELTVSQVAEVHKTRLEEVEDDRLGVAVPIKRLRPRPLPTGHLVRASFDRNRLAYHFVSEVLGHSSDGQLDYLSFPGTIESSDRRGAFRLTCSLRPRSVYRLVIDPSNPPAEGDELPDCTLLDLSEGGLCLNTRGRSMSGERLGVHVDLPDAGELKVRVRVMNVQEPQHGGRYRRLHCQFIELSRYDRDLVAKFLMKRQLAMRRRGQL